MSKFIEDENGNYHNLDYIDMIYERDSAILFSKWNKSTKMYDYYIHREFAKEEDAKEWLTTKMDCYTL